MYRGGLRSEEALSLYPKDLNPEMGTLQVLHGKSIRSRVVGFDDGAWTAALAMVTSATITAQREWRR